MVIVKPHKYTYMGNVDTEKNFNSFFIFVEKVENFFDFKFFQKKNSHSTIPKKI